MYLKNKYKVKGHNSKEEIYSESFQIPGSPSSFPLNLYTQFYSSCTPPDENNASIIWQPTTKLQGHTTAELNIDLHVYAEGRRLGTSEHQNYFLRLNNKYLVVNQKKRELSKEFLPKVAKSQCGKWTIEEESTLKQHASLANWGIGWYHEILVWCSDKYGTYKASVKNSCLTQAQLEHTRSHAVQTASLRQFNTYKQSAKVKNNTKGLWNLQKILRSCKTSGSKQDDYPIDHHGGQQVL